MSIDHKTAEEILRAAHEAVKGAKLPGSLEVPAFEKAVDLLAAQVGLAVAPAAPPPDTGAPPGSEDQGGEKSLAQVASTLKLKPDLVGEVFHIDKGELKLTPAASKFESAKSAATKEIALLVAAGRQAGGWDEDWTTTANIRQVCDDYGKYDTANFSTTILDMGDVFSFSGTGQSRKVKVNRKGKEQAAKLVKKLAGEETT
jgi:hypothetical protein